MKQLACVSQLSEPQNYLVCQRIMRCMIIPKGIIIPSGREAIAETTVSNYPTRSICLTP